MQMCSHCGGEYSSPVELHHDERECALRRAGVDWITPPESFEQALIAYGALTEVIVRKQSELESLRTEMAAQAAGRE
jgi:hypothetical protein